MLMHKPQGDTVALRLSPDEALVLDSLLSRFDQSSDWDRSLVIGHPAERAALWALQAALERVLTDTFSPDYDRILDSARERLRTKAGL